MISVIVPVYNVGKYLNRCIQSILMQTYKDFELILVNDGSTDGSELLCEQYAKTYACITVIHQENAGLSAARNAGISAAKGEYITFIDSDDFIHAKMLEILCSNLEEYDADLSICDFRKLKEEELIPDETGENIVECFDGSAVMQQLFEKEINTIVAWNKLYKRHIFNRVKFREGKLHEDEYMVHYLLYECKRTVYTSCKLYYYMQHAGTIMSSLMNQKRLQDIIQAYIERLSFFEEKHMEEYYEKTFIKLVYTYTDCYQRLEEQNTAEKGQLQKWLLQDMHRRLIKYRKRNPYSADEYLCYFIWSRSPKWGGWAFYLREKYNSCVYRLKILLDSDRRK